MNYILSLLLLVSSLSTNILSHSNIQDPCEIATKKAKEDQVKNQLKYYTFGIALFPVDQAKKMREKYQIEVISLGCMVDPEKMCYNQYVDNMLFFKTGMDFYGLAKK